MHDRILAHQDALLLPSVRAYASELGLDLERFWVDLRGRKHAARVAEDVESVDASGVTGTPSFFVNGRRHGGGYGLATVAQLVRESCRRRASSTMTPCLTRPPREPTQPRRQRR
jgi:predicted DsbA family dithiol-disulfide isomerase